MNHCNWCKHESYCADAIDNQWCDSYRNSDHYPLSNKEFEIKNKMKTLFGFPVFYVEEKKILEEVKLEKKFDKEKVFNEMPFELRRKAINFLAKFLDEDSKKNIAEAFNKNPDNWIIGNHFGWGMYIRNILRTNCRILDEKLPTGNWDDYYVQCIEAACGLKNKKDKVMTWKSNFIKDMNRNELIEIIEEQDRLIKQRDSIIDKLRLKEWFQDPNNLNIKTPSIFSSSIPVPKSWKSSELRKVLAPIIPDGLSLISKWKPGITADTIIGSWAEDGTVYTLFVPYQLRNILIILQNLLPNILDVIESNLDKE